MEQQIVSKELFGQRFSSVLEDSSETTYTIAEKLSLTPGTISRYANGLMAPKIPTLYMLANILNVNPLWLMGYDAPKLAEKCTVSDEFPPNLRRLEPMQKIPLVGRIACGEPILAVENIEDYIDLPRQIHADFALTCKGDSMVNAGIQDGDVVYIKEQPTVENGQIAAVMVGDEATLKRFYHTEDSVRLVAENPTFPTLSFFGEEMAQIRVIGLAVAYTHALVK